jgi:t-SNARE complex subunit (syntaxin)
MKLDACLVPFPRLSLHLPFYEINQMNAGESSSGAGSASMQQFFKDVELVKKHILVIRNSTKRVAEINQQVILATTNESENEESQELQLLITDTNKKAAIAKQMLKKLNEETESLKVAPGNKQSEIRIRENLSNTLTRKFVDVMKEYQTAQTKYKTDIKKKVKRQVQIIKPDATQEEIDAILQAGGGSGEIMKAAILKVALKGRAEQGRAGQGSTV